MQEQQKTGDMKLQVGTEMLVTGPHHFEKALITKVEKGKYTLDNGIELDYSLKPLNSKMTIAMFNQLEYDYLVAMRNIPRYLRQLTKEYESLSVSNVLLVNKKLSKLITLISE